MHSDYEIAERLPTQEEHEALFHSVGWDDHMDARARAASLAGSLHGVVALSDGVAVAMARVVGDGAHYFYVQDVVVHPDHEENGLGPKLTSVLIDWIRSRSQPTAFVGLFASPQAEDMYADLGFVTSGMTGMHLDRS